MISCDKNDLTMVIKLLKVQLKTVKVVLLFKLC